MGIRIFVLFIYFIFVTQRKANTDVNHRFSDEYINEHENYNIVLYNQKLFAQKYKNINEAISNSDWNSNAVEINLH